MSGLSGNGKLRQWLIEQVDGGKYPGLVWEDSDKTVFRIPWKHAGKQDYNRDEDAALFKVGCRQGLREKLERSESGNGSPISTHSLLAGMGVV